MDTVLKMEKAMDGDWKQGTRTLEELIKEYDLNCVLATLLNAFKREGIRQSEISS
jgi:hypothetical protein